MSGQSRGHPGAVAQGDREPRCRVPGCWGTGYWSAGIWRTGVTGPRSARQWGGGLLWPQVRGPEAPPGQRGQRTTGAGTGRDRAGADSAGQRCPAPGRTGPAVPSSAGLCRSQLCRSRPCQPRRAGRCRPRRRDPGSRRRRSCAGRIPGRAAAQRPSLGSARLRTARASTVRTDATPPAEGTRLHRGGDGIRIGAAASPGWAEGEVVPGVGCPGCGVSRVWDVPGWMSWGRDPGPARAVPAASGAGPGRGSSPWPCPSRRDSRA